MASFSLAPFQALLRLPGIPRLVVSSLVGRVPASMGPLSVVLLQHTRAAGLPRIRLHDVRHSYATAALVAGVPPKVISQRLGHATIAITMDTYSHVIPGLDEQAAETVARLILGDGEPVADLPANKPLATGPNID
jgi:integrase